MWKNAGHCELTRPVKEWVRVITIKIHFNPICFLSDIQLGQIKPINTTHLSSLNLVNMLTEFLSM